MTIEEKLALVKAGRKDRGEYMARAAIKRKKEVSAISRRMQEGYATCCEEGKGG
ncbi:hypothetical protein OROMI_020660 [Orobanche minor]